jgi:hypothetical protein
MNEGIKIQTTMVGEDSTCERIKILSLVLLERVFWDVTSCTFVNNF